VAILQEKGRTQYKQDPATKLLATINRCIREIVSREPNAAEFRQGKTLGADNRHWFRAKFHERYRLFYRFSSKEKVIVYAWVKDEETLCKAGSKTDPYSVFRAMLAGGNPPGTMAELLAVTAKIETARSSQQQAINNPRKKSNRQNR
jgi:toxin YhaV